MKRVTLLCIWLITQIPCFAFDKEKTVQQVQQLRFEENRGQFADQHGRPRADIQFRLQAPGMTVFIGNGQLHYQFYKTTPGNISLPPQLKKSMQQQHWSLPGAVVTYRMDVLLAGANEHAEMITEGMNGGVTHYYTGRSGTDGITNVRAFSKITYKNIYPGIDWVLYVKNNALKYDFVVHPGGNANKIQLNYNGTSAISLQHDGSVLAVTPFGSVTEEKPYAYQQQNKQPVQADFKLSGNNLGFSTGSYNGTLVIDPGVAWATYFGGDMSESCGAITCDNDGYIYMAGSASSASGIATSGSFQDTLSGGLEDAFIAKFDSLGNRIWTTYYGGDSSYSNVFFGQGLDVASHIVYDNAGHLYVAGTTNSTNNIATPGSFQDTLSALAGNSFLGTDAFLVKFDTSGMRLWGTYYGGDSSDEGLMNNLGLAYDATGQLVNMVTSACNTGMATPGAFQASFAGGTSSGDALIVQFNPAGVRQWATYFGSDADEYGSGISCDAEGNIYVGGNTTSTSGIASPNAFQTFSPGVDNIGFLARFNRAGTMKKWATYYGYYGEVVYAVTCDKFGHVYMTGQTSTVQTATLTNIITTPGAWQTMFGAGGFAVQWDGFLVQFDTSGNRHWGTYYGGEEYDYGYDIACDALGHVYLSGTTTSTSMAHREAIATPGAHQDSLCGVSGGAICDAYLAQFDTAGHRLWATYYGGPGFESGSTGLFPTMAVACDYGSNVYLAGGTSSFSNIATPGSFQDTNKAVPGSGNMNAFLVRFSPENIKMVNCSVQGDTLCTGNPAFSATITNTGTLPAANINVKCKYKNITTNITDSLMAVVPALLPGNSATINPGNLNLTQGVYNLKVYVQHVTDDSSFADDTLSRVFYVKDCSGTGVSSLNIANRSVTIYPNPAKDIFSVKLSGIKADELSVINSVGAVVYRSFVAASQTIITVNAASLTSGYYLLRIKTDNGYEHVPFEIIK